MKKEFQYSVQKIADDFYFIDERFSSMCVIEGKDRAVVVDCGVGVGDFKKVVDGLTALPYDLICTHGHVDHVGGRGQFDTMYISAVDAQIVKEATVFQRKALTFFNRLTTAKDVKGNTMDIKRIAREPKMEVLKEGDCIDLGGRTIEVIASPAHTLGSLCFLVKEDGILIAGDVLNDALFLWLNHAATVDEALETVCKLDAIKSYDKVICSHFGLRTRAQAVGVSKRLLEDLQKKKNTILPLVKTYKDKSGESASFVLYRSSHIH